MSKDKCCVPERVLPSGIGGVEFRDGAVVTAGDLNRATEYPLQLLKRFIKGFFGCGVVDGLEVFKVDEEPWKIRVTPGVAIDANGLPLELVRETQMDLSCLRCAEVGAEGNTYTVGISYGRGGQANAVEQCGAVTNAGNSEGVKITVFGADCEPPGLCKKGREEKKPDNSICPPCSADDAGESWVPVWCVKVVATGDGDKKKPELVVLTVEDIKSNDCRLDSCFKGCSKPSKAEESDLTVLERLEKIEKITNILHEAGSYKDFKAARDGKQEE